MLKSFPSGKSFKAKRTIEEKDFSIEDVVLKDDSIAKEPRAKDAGPTPKEEEVKSKEEDVKPKAAKKKSKKESKDSDK